MWLLCFQLGSSTRCLSSDLHIVLVSTLRTPALRLAYCTFRILTSLHPNIFICTTSHCWPLLPPPHHKHTLTPPRLRSAWKLQEIDMAPTGISIPPSADADPDRDRERDLGGEGRDGDRERGGGGRRRGGAVDAAAAGVREGMGGQGKSTRLSLSLSFSEHLLAAFPRNNPGNNLHVSGLSQKIDSRDLEEAFGKMGRVHFALPCCLPLPIAVVLQVQKESVMYDPHTHESGGFGFMKAFDFLHTLSFPPPALHRWKPAKKPTQRWSRPTTPSAAARPFVSRRCAYLSSSTSSLVWYVCDSAALANRLSPGVSRFVPISRTSHSH
ncbi:RNA-binding domain-containing protein [Mycena venus]|uniref:RNA-binding domain-containing protein n=1 Tax=Mycena venus TaxID=2733690 RepID=A0A8H6XJ60_9AGAR|nr:RNA-binding domain-containing protein [Mycena venus]